MKTYFACARNITLSFLLLYVPTNESCRGKLRGKAEKILVTNILKRGLIYQALNEFLLSGSGKLDKDDYLLRPAALKQLQAGMAKASAFLREHHNQNVVGIKRRFPGASVLPSTLLISLQNSPTVTHQIDGNTIYTSSRTFKSIIRGWLTGMITSESGHKLPSEMTIPEAEAINTLETFAQLLSKGDLTKLSELRESDQKMKFIVEAAKHNSSMHVVYNFMVFFMIAHEQGHYALGHFGKETLENSIGCLELQQLELEADRYAAYLLYTMYYPFAIALEERSDLPEEVIVTPDSLEVYFYTASPAAFSAKGGQCPHPLEAERVKAIESAKGLAYEDAKIKAKGITNKELLTFIKNNGWYTYDYVRHETIYKFKLRVIYGT
jgi:hypothetical protein